MTTRTFPMRPRPIAHWMFAEFLAIYAGVCVLLFLFLVNPSLTGLTDQHIAADSTTYIYMADVLQQHVYDPMVYIALASFPNTLWVPVFIAYILNSTVLTVLFDIGVFIVSIRMLATSEVIDVPCLLFLLLINLTTTISLLSVNKEIIDLLALALFCRFLTSKRKRYLLLSLLLSLLNRYEVFLAFVAFLLLKSRWNPLRARRWLTLLSFLLALSFLVPWVAAHELPAKFASAIAEAAEAHGGGTVVFLDRLQMHYLFIVAAIPKVCENLFGEFLNPLRIAHYSTSDLANSYIILSNNIANALVLFYLWMRGRLAIGSISSDWIYLAMTSAALLSISLVVQPRYFYLVYVLLCLEAARKNAAPAPNSLSFGHRGLDYA